jgi:hypothetical protein
MLLGLVFCQPESFFILADLYMPCFISSVGIQLTGLKRYKACVFTTCKAKVNVYKQFVSLLLGKKLYPNGGCDKKHFFIKQNYYSRLLAKT